METAPDVLFVVLDSARIDRLSTYGHDRQTTPALDELAEGATVFENAYTPAPWTLPSHCSMFTGLFPSEHGVTNGFTDRNFALQDDVPILTELLSERGYRTAGFSNNPWVGALSGLTRGFDEFVEWDLEISRSGRSGIHNRRDRAYSKGHELLGHAARQPHVLLKRRFFTARLVDRARRWLDRPARVPTFTFLNLMEAHSPYYPPKRAFRILGLEPPNPLEARLLNVRLLAYVMGKQDLSPAQRERVLEFYDASLRYQDAKLEELVSLLETRSLFDDTLIVVCADHGKTLGDVDRDAVPPHYLRNSNVNVPLIVKFPGQTGGDREPEPFELTNLFHLIRDGGQPSPDDVRTQDGMALTEDFVPHTGRSTADVTRWRALSDGERRYVRNERGDEYFLTHRNGHGSETGSPADAIDSDVVARYRDAMDRRAALIQTADGREEETPAQEMGSAVQGQLKDLGYLE